MSKKQQQDSRALIPDLNHPIKEQLAAVGQNGHAIQWIPNPSLQVQLAAVGQKGAAIRYIPTPTSEVQLAAVRQDGRAIRWIPNPCLFARLIGDFSD